MFYLCWLVMDYHEIERTKAICNILLTIYALTAVFYASEYITFTLYYGFYQPFPHHFTIQALYIFWMMGFALYFQFPTHLREDPNFRAKEISYEEDIMLFENRTKLKINIEGCVNTLSEECKDFYSRYGT